MARKAKSMKRPRAASAATKHRRYVHGPAGREYMIMDELADDLITPSMWAAIESFEDSHMPTETTVMKTTQVIESQSASLCYDICPDSADEASDVEEAVEDGSSRRPPEIAPTHKASPISSNQVLLTSQTDSPRELPAPCDEGVDGVDMNTTEAAHEPAAKTNASHAPPSPEHKSPTRSPCLTTYPGQASDSADGAPEGAPSSPQPALADEACGPPGIPVPTVSVFESPPPRVVNTLTNVPLASQGPSSPPSDSHQSQTVIPARLPPPSPHPSPNSSTLVPDQNQNQEHTTSDLTPSDPTPTTAPTPPPQELDAVQVLVSLNPQCPSLASWLRHEGDIDHDHMTSIFDDDAPATPSPPDSPPPPAGRRPCPSGPMEPPPHTSHVPSVRTEELPPHLRRRCHVTPPTSAARQSPDDPQTIVLWIQQTWRVHDNFALAAAEWLQATYDRPIVAFCVLSATLFYPTAAWSGGSATNENGVRSSVASMRRQLQARGIPLEGVLAPHDNTALDVATPLLSLNPWAIVTDDTVESVVPSALPAIVFQMDSTCCIPWRSMVAEGSGMLTKAEFQAKWLAALSEYVHDQPVLPPPAERPPRQSRVPTLTGTLPWPNLDKPSPFDLSERAALAHFDATCVQVGPAKPALQEELHGRGVTSCLPFLRHGSLSAMHVLATLKATSNHVLYSRALTHCVLAREYAMYELLHLKRGHTATAATVVTARQLSVYRPLVAQIPPPRAVPSNDGTMDDGARTQELLLPHQLEASRSPDPIWNDIMTHVRVTGYLHPVLAAYWGRRLLFDWSPSPLAGLGVLEALVMRYTIGASTDVVVQLLLAIIHDDAAADKLAGQTPDDHPLLAQLRAAIVSHRAVS